MSTPQTFAEYQSKAALVRTKLFADMGIIDGSPVAQKFDEYYQAHLAHRQLKFSKKTQDHALANFQAAEFNQAFYHDLVAKLNPPPGTPSNPEERAYASTVMQAVDQFKKEMGGPNLLEKATREPYVNEDGSLRLAGFAGAGIGLVASIKMLWHSDLPFWKKGLGIIGATLTGGLLTLAIPAIGNWLRGDKEQPASSSPSDQLSSGERFISTQSQGHAYNSLENLSPEARAQSLASARHAHLSHVPERNCFTGTGDIGHSYQTTGYVNPPPYVVTGAGAATYNSTAFRSQNNIPCYAPFPGPRGVNGGVYNPYTGMVINPYTIHSSSNYVQFGSGLGANVASPYNYLNHVPRHNLLPRMPSGMVGYQAPPPGQIPGIANPAELPNWGGEMPIGMTNEQIRQYPHGLPIAAHNASGKAQPRMY